MRLLDFAAVAALLILSQPVTKTAAIKPLVLLGQSSLQVFCVHLLFCFAGLTLMGNASMLNGWRQFTLLGVTFTAMLITAKIFSKSEAKNERQGPTQISSGPDPARVTALRVGTEQRLGSPRRSKLVSQSRQTDGPDRQTSRRQAAAETRP